MHARLADSPECPVSGPDYSLPLTSPIADLCQSSRAHLALPHSPKLLPSPCWSLQLLIDHAGVGDGDVASPSSGASRAAAAAALPLQRRRRCPGSRRSAKPACCCTHCPRLATLATAAAAAGTGLQCTGSKWQQQQRRRHGERHDSGRCICPPRNQASSRTAVVHKHARQRCIPSLHPRLLLLIPAVDPHLWQILTLPTVLTLARVAAVPALVAAWYSPAPWAPAACTALFVGASLTDYLDGYLARAMVSWHELWLEGRQLADGTAARGVCLPAAPCGQARGAGSAPWVAGMPFWLGPNGARTACCPSVRASRR